MNQACRQLLAATVLSQDKNRGAHLCQQFRLGAQFAHGGTGSHKKHVVTDVLNFVAHGFAFALSMEQKRERRIALSSCSG